MNTYKVSAVIKSLVFADIQAETSEEAKKQFADKVKEIIDKEAYCDWIAVDKDSMIAPLQNNV